MLVEWHEKCSIRFTFDSNKCFYGLFNNPEFHKISDDKRKIIHENLNKLGINSIKETNVWPVYEYFRNLSLDTWESEIINSDIFINDCKSKIEKLLKAMDGVTL